MTIAAAYLTSEGVVFGADSTSTISVKGPQGAGVAQLLNHAQKVFEIGEPGRGRLGLCTWGAGRIRATSHRTIVARLADRIVDDRTTVEEAAQYLKEITQEAHKAGTPSVEPSVPVGYFLGGWDPKSHEPKCYSMAFDQAAGGWKEALLKEGEASFAGTYSYFSRVFHGFDPNLPRLLLGELVKRMAVQPSVLEPHLRAAFSAAEAKLASVGFRDLPIREAIDYVHTYLHLTIKAYKFRYGPYPAGGPIEIGFITTDRRFRWACHKTFTSAVFEQEAAENE